MSALGRIADYEASVKPTAGAGWRSVLLRDREMPDRAWEVG